MTHKDAMRALFFQPGAEQNLRRLVERNLDAALNFLKPQSENKLHSDLSLPDLESLFHEVEIPFQGIGVEKALQLSSERVVKHSVQVADPHYIGHMTGATPYFHLGLELLIAALNQNVVKIETALAGSFVEGQLLAWIHRLVFGRNSDYYKARMHKPDLCLGNVTSGGTMGNLTALAVARNKKIPRCKDWGVSEALERMGKRKVGIYASKRVHYSIRKAASVLGLGTQSVHEIPVVPFTNQIDIAALERTMMQHQAQGILPLVIVGVAGSTETGSSDDLSALAALAQKTGAWFHVDAAWGGPLLLCERGRKLFAGIELADSVIIDGHKLFYVPMAQGMVVFRDESALDVLRHTARYIIRSGSVDLGRTSLEGSRRFDSFKLWFALWAIGGKNYAQLMEYSLSLAGAFEKLINESDCFELTSEVKTNIVTWRFVPAAWKAKLERLRQSVVEQKREDVRVPTLHQLTALLNETTVEIQKIQRQSGKSFVSRTTLESVIPGFDTVVFRAVLFHPLTSQQALSEVLSEQKSIGESVLARLWPKFESQLAEWEKPISQATEN
ncbi:MAG: pyridoxal-dependent decarboxylase [Silvanigrellaceae bacterium]